MKKIWMWLAPVAVAGLIACGSGGGSDDKGKVTSDGAAATAGAADTKTGGDKTPGVYKFGQTIKFKDGSTLLVGKPVTFKRDKYAAGGEGKKVFLKVKATFKNNTKDVFDPALTTASMSADGAEGESIFQEGLDTPDNKILPGKSVTWTMGYGVDSANDVQLEVNVGFLDYGTAIFTK